VEAINQETRKGVKGLFGGIMKSTGILNEDTVSQCTNGGYSSLEPPMG